MLSFLTWLFTHWPNVYTLRYICLENLKQCYFCETSSFGFHDILNIESVMVTFYYILLSHSIKIIG